MGTRTENKKNKNVDEDHPHAYGDKMQVKDSLGSKLGSSPRVWGQVDTGNVNKGSQRIIPTRMGTSPDKQIICRFAQDHPHAYGDKCQ